MRKAGIGVVVFWVVCTAGWAQQAVERPYWYTMERGKLYFRNGAYGDALIAFETARDQRRNIYAKMEQDMIALLSIPEVRRLGDSLDLIESYITNRNQLNARHALDELYYRVPKSQLGGSAKRVLEHLRRLKDYPEAEYWIGETYRTEGELGIALKQYQKAYEQRALLETAGFEVDILYKIADIHRIRQEYSKMEEALLDILKQDSLWTQGAGSFMWTGMSRVLENDGINRFLTIYRHNSPAALRAHELLGYYYFASGRHNRAAEHFMFAFIMQNSTLIREVTRGRFDYTFSTLDALLYEIGRQPSLQAYIEEHEYFKIMYYLGTAYYGSGKLQLAWEFWSILNRHLEAGEWQIRAQTQLRNPSMEQVIEMP